MVLTAPNTPNPTSGSLVCSYQADAWLGAYPPRRVRAGRACVSTVPGENLELLDPAATKLLWFHRSSSGRLGQGVERLLLVPEADPVEQQPWFCAGRLKKRLIMQGSL